MDHFQKAIRNIPDFPKPGIVFRDITPLIGDGVLFHQAIEAMIKPFLKEKIEKVVGIDSRGFIFGAAVAFHLGVGFVPVRKKGKLPFKKISEDYQLEYGLDRLEIHEDSINSGQNVLIVDDVLATGGTVEAVEKMVKRLRGNVVGMSFLIELAFLNGRKKMNQNQYPIHSLISHDSE